VGACVDLVGSLVVVGHCSKSRRGCGFVGRLRCGFRFGFRCGLACGVRRWGLHVGICRDDCSGLFVGVDMWCVAVTGCAPF